MRLVSIILVALVILAFPIYSNGNISIGEESKWNVTFDSGEAPENQIIKEMERIQKQIEEQQRNLIAKPQNQTGQVQTYQVQLSPKEVISFMKEIWKILGQILDLFEKFFLENPEANATVSAQVKTSVVTSSS